MTKKRKKITNRKCIGCGQIKEKQELIRIVRTPDLIVRFDLSGKLNGRGAYICPNLACLKKGITEREIYRALQIEVDQAFIDDMFEEILDLGIINS